MCKTLVFISFSSSSNDLFQSVHKAFVIFYILKRIKNCKSLILHPKITLKVSNEVNFFFFFFFRFAIQHTCSTLSPSHFHFP